jgi:DNA-binding NarL/FixJ family response regulator
VTPSRSNNLSARDAATLYAEDEEFARDFEQALQEIYDLHIARLARIRRRLGDRDGDTQRSAAEAVATPVTPERVHEIVHAAPARGLTRGDIATRLGISSRDARLTTVLRSLKADQLLRQSGARRAARYFAAGPEHGSAAVRSTGKRSQRAAAG